MAPGISFQTNADLASARTTSGRGLLWSITRAVNGGADALVVADVPPLHPANAMASRHTTTADRTRAGLHFSTCTRRHYRRLKTRCVAHAIAISRPPDRRPSVSRATSRARVEAQTCDGEVGMAAVRVDRDPSTRSRGPPSGEVRGIDWSVEQSGGVKHKANRSRAIVRGRLETSMPAPECVWRSRDPVARRDESSHGRWRMGWCHGLASGGKSCAVRRCRARADGGRERSENDDEEKGGNDALRVLHGGSLRRAGCGDSH